MVEEFHKGREIYLEEIIQLIVGFNAEMMQHYLLQDVLTKNGLMNVPHQICNVDESGVPLDLKALNVVAKKGSKKVVNRKEGTSNVAMLLVK